VARELAVWPEMGQREKLWATTEAAAATVDEPELQAVLKAFRP